MDQVSTVTTKVKKNSNRKILSSQQRKSIIDAYKRKTKENPTIRIRILNGVLSKELQIGIGHVSKTVKEYRESVKSSNRTAVSKTVSNKAVKFNTMKRKFLSPRQIELIVDAYKRKIEETPTINIKELSGIISRELRIKIDYVYKTIIQYRENKTVALLKKIEIRETMAHEVNDIEKYSIRRKVRQFWFDYQAPTVDKILTVVNDDKNLPNFSRSTFYELLKSMEFELIKHSDDELALLENKKIVNWRRRYLEVVKEYRKEGRSIYYLGETCMYTKDPAEGPNGKERCFTIGHIGSEDGFVYNGLFCMKSEKKELDYSNIMCPESFRYWLKIMILPSLKENSVIVMDPRRLINQEEYPTEIWATADIIAWIKNKGGVMNECSMSMADLFKIVQRLKPANDKDDIYEMLKKQNKKVLWLPPDHHELNPMELAWSVVYKQVDQSDKEIFSFDDVRHFLGKIMDKIDATNMWKNFVKRVIEEEDKLLRTDRNLTNINRRKTTFNL